MKNPVPRKIPPSGKQALDVTSSSCLGGGGHNKLILFLGGQSWFARPNCVVILCKRFYVYS